MDFWLLRSGHGQSECTLPFGPLNLLSSLFYMNLFTVKTTAWSPFLCLLSQDSYSAAGSEGSISTSVASLPPQASGSSAPSSPGSRRSVSTLKKWLTNPVRKLSAGATAKGERQVRKLDGKPPPFQSHSNSLDLGLGSPPRPDDTFTILPDTHRELVRFKKLEHLSHLSANQIWQFI